MRMKLKQIPNRHPSGGANEVEGDASSRYHSDASSIQPLIMLLPGPRARAVRLEAIAVRK